MERMAKAWQYPRWRYYLMQAVMWGVLAAMVGAAGLVDHHRRKSLEVKLSAPQTKRNLAIQLPEGWKSSRKFEPDSPILFQLEDPVLHRTLQVIREPHTEFVSPAQYLVRSFGKTADVEVEPFMMAGNPGALARATLNFDDQQEDASDLVQIQIVAAATVLPSGHAVAVQVIGAASPTRMDEDLVRRIAATIEAHGEPKMTDENIRLRDGTTIDLPDGYSAIVQEDPNRSAREIRLQPGGANLWRGVALIPIVVLPTDGLDEIATLCTAWDSSWKPAQTKLLGPRRWRVERASESWSGHAVSQIRVMGDAQGHGLMAVFEGSGSDDSWIDPLWTSISDGTKFSQASDLKPRMETGAQFVGQVRQHGLQNFLGETRPETWWLYCRETPDHPIGWLHEEPAASIWRQSNETRFSFPDRGTATIRYQWEGSPKLADYDASIQRKIADSDGNEQSHLRIAAKLAGGKLSLSASGTDVDNKARLTPPATFLPGGWASLLIGKLPEKPMILESESFIGYEGAATGSLMRLIITPTSDVAHSGQADAKPLRCVNVEVNGSGEISRWYFKADGTLDSIDYADGFRRVRSDLLTIRNSFTAASMMP
jgi:hypothetical protein